MVILSENESIVNYLIFIGLQSLNIWVGYEGTVKYAILPLWALPDNWQGLIDITKNNNSRNNTH